MGSHTDRARSRGGQQPQDTSSLKREPAISPEEMDQPLAEFLIQTERDVRWSAQRGRLLGMLTRLSTPRRRALGKAVGKAADWILGCGGGTVQFGLRTEDDRAYALALLNLPAPASAEEPGCPAVALDLRSLVDQFQVSRPQEGGVAIRIAVLLEHAPPVLAATESGLWATILRTRSTHGALLDSQYRLREVEQSLFELKRRGLDLAKELEQIRTAGEANELLSLVASRTDNSVAILDLEGHVEWVNNGFTRATGYELADVRGQRIDAILTGPQTGREVTRTIQQALRQGHGVTQELLRYRRDGRTFWEMLTLTPVFDAAGSVSRWVVIGSDVTARRQAAEALARAKEAAESSSRAKSDFLANMSHEIRTPMNAVIGMTELALTTDMSNEQREYLTTVRESATALLKLLNDILDLSKIEAGKMDIDRVEFDVPQLLKATFKPFALQAERKGLEFIWHLAPETPPRLVGDPGRLRQVLVNLVGNALKFTDQGEIEVRVEPQWTNPQEAALHIAVRDTGVGIAADKLEKVFEAFTQGDNSTTRQFGGTGLGLTISSQLVALMGGRLWVQSEMGRGTTFHLSLRFGIAAERAKALAEAESAQLAGMRVLVVDDNATNRKILKLRLEGWGMQPTLSDSAQSALSILKDAAQRGEPFPLLLVDASMPKMDGFDLVRQINQSPDVVVDSVMMLSSADQPGEITRCRELDIGSYLRKPVSSSELLEAILATLGKARRRPPPVAACDAAPPAATKLRVLVADDNEANRVLASRILEKRGHEVEAATNGREVVERVERTAFDVVLMDIQMPHVDGYTATAAIREREKQTGKHVPIIAMTAHAMQGDRQRCLDTGMDSYIAKPLGVRELYTVVESLGAGLLTEAARKAACPGASRRDFAMALARLDGDQELLREQMEYFLKDGPALVDKIDAAIRTQSARQLQLAAHRLKGLVSSFDDPAGTETAFKLELLGQENRFDGARASLEQLRESVNLLSEAMECHLAGPN